MKRMSDEELEEALQQSERAQKAMLHFMEGYNCSQSLVLTFSDFYQLDKATMLSLSSPFGGGMGRLREVCGAVSGMFMVLGLLYGYDDPKDFEAKKQLYERVQYLAEEYKKMHGSIICGELLGLKEKGPQSPIPDKRTPEYYKKRPCPKMIGSAALLLERYIKENPI